MKPKIPVATNNLCWFDPAAVQASALLAALRGRGSPRRYSSVYR